MIEVLNDEKINELVAAIVYPLVTTRGQCCP